MRKQTAIGYVRVSSERQSGIDRTSIEQQIANIADLAKRNGFELLDTLIDKDRYRKTKPPHKNKVVQPSGKYDDRPQFITLLEQVEGGSVDNILVFDVSRLGRHLRVLGALANSLDIAKTKRDGREAIIWETGKNSTINGIMLNIMISLYQEENEARARRANEGKEGKLKKGYWPATFQKFGYMTIRDAIGVKIVEGSPSEIKTVQQIFDWYDSGVGCTEIRRRLIANGVEQQEDFTGQRLHDWNTSTIGNLLRSKEYTGVVTFKFKNGNTFDFSIPQFC